MKGLKLSAFGVGLDEHLTHQSARQRLAGFRHAGQEIAQEMHPTALPAGGKHLADSGLQALVSVGNNQLDPAQTPLAPAPQAIHPEDLHLRIAQPQAQNFAPPVLVDAAGDDGGDRHDSTALADFEIGGIEPQGRLFALDGSLQKRFHPLVEVAAQGRDLAFGNAGHP